ncbi:MAG: metallophosphoesterase [Clostridia bacterium]|nr:metallophosphoesterase [Clostridia bacterium]
MIIFAADLHIRNHTFSAQGLKINDSLTGFQRVLETAKDARKYGEPVSIVLGGDIWDTKRITPDLLEEAIRLRNRYLDIPIYYINGNHDDILPSWTSFLGNTIHLGPEPVTLPGGETVSGMDYTTPRKIKENLESVQVSDFLVVHQFVEDREDSFISASVPLETYARFPVVLAGDIHEQRHLYGKHTDLLYSGPAYRCSIPEPEGGCLLLSKERFLLMCRTLNNCYKAMYQSFEIRPMTHLTFDGPFTMARIEEFRQKWEPERYRRTLSVSPLTVLHAEAFEEEAVKYLLDHYGSKDGLDPEKGLFLFRRTVPVQEQIVPSENTDAVLASNALSYAIESLQTYQTEDRVKELARDALTNEDKFFEDLKEHFSL